MPSNVRIYIRSIQDKFMLFSFLNKFYTYLTNNLVLESNNFFQNKVIANKIKVAQEEYKIKKDNIFVQVENGTGINFVK